MVPLYRYKTQLSPVLGMANLWDTKQISLEHKHTWSTATFSYENWVITRQE